MIFSYVRLWQVHEQRFKNRYLKLKKYILKISQKVQRRRSTLLDNDGHQGHVELVLKGNAFNSIF